jgi:thiamine pyrophosphate-dependent acetolactate synthase large subunit-like protein
VSFTCGQLLDRVLRAQGVDRVYGRDLPGVETVRVQDAGVATLMMAAHERVHRARAAAHLGDGEVVIGAGAAEVVVVTDPAQLVDIRPPVRLRIDLEIRAPAPDIAPPLRPAPDRWQAIEPGILERIVRAQSPVGLVGPGIVDAAVIPELHAVATGGNLGVLNTWGAKGVFDWRSRHHWATVGLQANDLDLGGFAGADLVVACGLDPDETPPFEAPVAVVPTASLGSLAEHWSRPCLDLVVPPLRTRLAEITQRGWLVHRAPLAPSRVTSNYADCFGAGGMVAADAGIPGFWVARTFPTTVVGSAVVPGRAMPGFAIACALVARLAAPRRPVLAVLDDTISEPAALVLGAAASLGVPVPVEIWTGGGSPLDAGAHLERLQRMGWSDRPEPVTVATDPSWLAEVLGVAGEIVAWGGLDPATRA